MINIDFTDYEIDFLSDSKIFPLKRALLDKLILLLDKIQQNLNVVCLDHNSYIPNEILSKKGKISKGENYNNQPYLVLDYPRYFNKNNIFCFRTIFWWGNYFSNALILSGSILDKYQNKIVQNLSEFKQPDWLFSVNEDPWKLESGKDNYIKISQLENELIIKHMQSYNYVKIARIYPISTYNEFSMNSIAFLKKLLDLLN